MLSLVGVMRRLCRVLLAWSDRDDTERELDEELRYHLERDAARYRARGWSGEEAWRAARRDFGRVAAVKEQVRDTWRLAWLRDLSQDVRYAWRGLRRAPGFALTVIGTIALALGLNTTIFTIFNTYVLRPIPVRDPDQLYELTVEHPLREGAPRRFSRARYEDLAARNAAFSQLFAYRFFVGRLHGTSGFGEAVSGNYFRMLGVGTALGRPIEPDDDLAPGAGPVVVLSHDAWRVRFGADSSIIGRHVLLDGRELEVVGVTAARFTGEQVSVDFWVPMSELGLLDPQLDVYGPNAVGWVGAVGRLRAGLDPTRATERLTRWAREVTDDSTVVAMLVSRATVLPLTPEVVAALTPIFVAFALVLLIACANVANMMLARGMARQREIGIRLSLGAGRARLIRQLLTEATLLAVPASALGFALSRLAIKGGVRLMYGSLPGEFATLIKVLPLTPDFRVFLFMLGVALVTALLFGLAPAIQTTRPRVIQATRGDLDGSPQATRLRSWLVVGQIAVCALLLIVAGILLRGASRMEGLDSGIRTRGALEIIVLEASRAMVIERLSQRVDVVSVAAATTAPLGGEFPISQFAGAATPGAAVHGGGYNSVSPSYFETFAIPIVSGRTFTEAEARGRAPVAVVSEAAARALWPGRDPVGATVYVALDPALVRAGPLRTFYAATVIGVARNVSPGAVGVSVTRPVIYYPTTLDAGGTTLLVRVAGDADRARLALARDLAAADSTAVQQIHTTEESRTIQLYPFHAASWVSEALGVVALLLTMTGVYGVLAYVVAQRTREIGVRMALGATAGRVVGLVLRQLAPLAAWGVAAGVAVSVAISTLAAAHMEHVNPFDPVGYVVGALLVLLACLAAAVVPSRRAAAVEPVTALRSD